MVIRHVVLLLLPCVTFAFSSRFSRICGPECSTYIRREKVGRNNNRLSNYVMEGLTLLLSKQDDDNSSSFDGDFAPTFDGQLFYGLEQKPGENEITTTLSEIREISARLNKNEKDRGVSGYTMGKDDRKEVNEFVWKGVKYPLKTRTVPLSEYIEDAIDVTVFELGSAETQSLVESWMAYETDDDEKNDDDDFDPFGVVMWPGSIIASEELYRLREKVKNKTVLVLGAGTGVEVQVATQLGAKHVIATDNNPMSLAILDHSISSAPFCHDIVETRIFDVFSSESLPPCDVLVAADVLYNEQLAGQIGRRFVEALSLDPIPTIVITDSQRFHGTDFLETINSQRSKNDWYMWKERNLEKVEVSGILIDDDQRINVKARLLSI